MNETTFGELGQGDAFYLEVDGQEYEKIALEHIQEIFSWTKIRSLVNCRWHPWCGPFTDKPEKYLYIEDSHPVFVEDKDDSSLPSGNEVKQHSHLTELDELIAEDEARNRQEVPGTMSSVAEAMLLQQLEAARDAVWKRIESLPDSPERKRLSRVYGHVSASVKAMKG